MMGLTQHQETLGKMVAVIDEDPRGLERLDMVLPRHDPQIVASSNRARDRGEQSETNEPALQNLIKSDQVQVPASPRMVSLQRVLAPEPPSPQA